METRASEAARMEQASLRETNSNVDREQQVGLHRVETRQSDLERTKELMDEGKILGLADAELRHFVINQKDKEQQRQLQREEQQMQLQQEQLRLEQEAARERERHDQEYRLEQLRLQTETLRTRVDAEGNANNNAQPRQRDTDNYQSKLPFFNGKDDDIEASIEQFERHATSNQWRDATWAPRLAALLQGEARLAYINMPTHDAGDYDLLKKTLLEHFHISAESYRNKFRHQRKSQNDTYKSHIKKLSLYMNRWIDMSDKGNNVDELKDLILQEQVLATLPDELITYVKDRVPQDVADIQEIIIRYEEARPSEHRRQRDHKRKDLRKKEEKPPENEHKKDDQLKRKLKCYTCNGPHLARYCPKRGNEESSMVHQDGREQVFTGMYEKLCPTCVNKEFTKFSEVTVEGKKTQAFRDTGSTSTIIDSSLVPKEKISVATKETTFADKTKKKQLQVAKVHVDTPYFVGETEVSVMDNTLYPVLIGNKMGIGMDKIETPVYPVRDPVLQETSAAVTTRAEEKRETTSWIPGDQSASMDSSKKDPTPKSTQNTKAPKDESLSSMADLKKEQREDETLTRLHELAQTNVHRGQISYEYEKDVLYRQYVDKQGKKHRQLVVPRKLRPKVLSVGHDAPMAGHLGQKKTRERVWQEFYWPGIVGDVKRYCMSCDTCQKTSPKGRTKRVQLGKMPIIETAFKRVAVDIVGPITPMSDSKKRYILVMVDYATRYPEAVAVKDIKAETIAEALWNFWTRLGLPDEILTDRGTQFTSDLMKEVNDLLSIKGLKTTPWHPQTNGLVERFNATLKQMLKKLAIEQPEKWDQYIPALLFAYREVPQESLGFSPFELLYGRTVKGPMRVLRQMWTEEETNDEMKTTAEYVTDLRNRIEETCQIARENLAKASLRQSRFYNKHARSRVLSVGMKVLLLLPTKHNKLELAWKGPYTVEEKVNSFDYRIKVGRSIKIYHINLLREYHERDKMLRQEQLSEEDEHIAIVVEDIEEGTNDYFADADAQNHIPTPSTKRTEFERDVHIGEKLTQEQRKDIIDACQEVSDNFTDVPKSTKLERCRIQMTESKPVFVKPRPIPHSQVVVVEKEVKEMLELGVIEPAASPYNSPIVLVKKADGKSLRFCNDLRELNKVVRFDAEPITDVEHLFSELSHARYFSKLDLTKGYWAIPIEEEDRDKTAFTTSLGQFRWVNLPFGLKTAGGIFNRMMRKLLLPLNRKDVHHFMDDILIATETWEQHIEAVRAVLKRLKEANLAAKPSKCYFGYDQLSYLGHGIGNGKKWPEDDKVQKIRSAKPPKTKKELRSILGTTNFYRGYISKYAEIAAPLTDKTKKHEPEHIRWNEECENAFNTLKEKLADKPVVVMPDLEIPFVIRTDASDRGLGAVLLQDQGKGPQPVAYASKKLNDAERNYATVEKECLATVWAIQKFERYLYGRHFVLETDHQPLQYLQRMKPTNARLMRWALQLQPYAFTVKVIPGKDNIGADYLSRLT